jgi:hypothetical protein
MILKMCQKQFIVNAEKDTQPYQNREMMWVFFPVLPVSEVWNMGYSAPWTLLNSLISSPGW